MHRRQRSFIEFLTRALTVSGLFYVVVVAYALVTALPAQMPGSEAGYGGWGDRGAYGGSPGWTPLYRDRFPGCVDMARWERPAVPRTVVVVRRDGTPARMPFGEAFRRATSGSSADDVWTVGACP